MQLQRTLPLALSDQEQSLEFSYFLVLLDRKNEPYDFEHFGIQLPSSSQTMDELFLSRLLQGLPQEWQKREGNKSENKD